MVMQDLNHMSRVQHYRGLNTDLDNLYKDAIQALEDEKDLQIVSEYRGILNGSPFEKYCCSK